MQEERQELIMLLKRCAINDRSAQEEFADQSFLNTVRRAVRIVIKEQGVRDRLTPEEIRSLEIWCVWEGVYQRAEEIVGQACDFRESLRLAAIAMTTRYLNAKLVVR